jgi:hypothetical protein
MRTGFALFAMSLVPFAGLSSATTFLFTTASPGVNYAVNNPTGFFVSSAPISSPLASADQSGTSFTLSATAPTTGYSDAGIVLYFNGGLTLGQLQDVAVVTDNPSAMNINLWVDTGGDGQFFAFDGTGMLTGLNGDSYGSFGQTTSLSASSVPAFFTAPASAHSTSLADLQNSYPNAPVAIWAGITNAGISADISSITVDATPEPASFLLIGAGLISITIIFRRGRSNTQSR